MKSLRSTILYTILIVNWTYVILVTIALFFVFLKGIKDAGSTVKEWPDVSTLVKETATATMVSCLAIIFYVTAKGIHHLVEILNKDV